MCSCSAGTTSLRLKSARFEREENMEKTAININKPRGLHQYQWEIFLVVLFLTVNVVNSFLSPYYPPSTPS
jgi:hypothetical protein